MSLTVREVESREAEPRVVRIRFADRLAPGTIALMTFADPAPRHAIVAGHPLGAMDVSRDGEDAVDVVITNSSRGVEVQWNPGRVALRCGAGAAQPALRAIAEFSHYERELRKLEQEIDGAWSALEHDKRLAYEVTPRDLEDQAEVGARMALALDRRIRHSRISPHLYRAGHQPDAVADEVADALREQAGVEDRLETIDGHLEVFEHVYEMASQRLGEFRASHKEHRLEWVIIILLATETLLFLLSMR